MAGAQGIKEKVHLPIYDSIRVEPRKQLRDVESSSILKFFVGVQGKTTLETNASLFSRFDRFEARGMRVVISDLPPEFPVEIAIADGEIELSLRQVVDLLRQAKDSEEGCATLARDDGAVTPEAAKASDGNTMSRAGGVIRLSTWQLERYLTDETFVKEKHRPLREQIFPNDGAGSLIGKLIYNTVTTLFVGEKIMIQMPTWFFPGGAGPRSDTASVTTHGEPSPAATFRFAEPIIIDKQQNFRVEVEVPHADFLEEMQRIFGPMFIWVVLDGDMISDAQPQARA